MMRSWKLLLVSLIVLGGVSLPYARASADAAAPRNQPIYDLRPGVRSLGAGPARPVGSMAPACALPTMESYLSLPPKTPPDTVQIANYRGKQPVVLLLTGFT